MRYKTQSDICFEKFSRYTKKIEDLDLLEVAVETINEFYPKKRFNVNLLNEFNNALSNIGTFKYRLNFSFKTAATFIDCENYLADNDLLSFAKIVIEKKYWWQKIFYSVAAVNHAVAEYYDYMEPIKERHEWIYNPPPIVNINKAKENTIKSEYMNDFVEYYGAYAEITYMLMRGYNCKFEEVINWPLDRYLFQGEYLLRKKRIESIN